MRSETIRSEIRARYTRAASLLHQHSAKISEPSIFLETGTAFGSALYEPADLQMLPLLTVAASLGCGSPATGAELRFGSHVLDLGCGAGIDVLLASRLVGPRGLVVGLDMTKAMLDLAQAGAHLVHASNVHFVQATMELLPFSDGVFETVVSNCAVNLCGDKRQVLTEAARVLEPDGTLCLTDVVADDALTYAERLERASQTGCTVGVLAKTEYLDLLAQAGFQDINIDLAHPVADRMSAARVVARKVG